MNKFKAIIAVLILVCTSIALLSSCNKANDTTPPSSPGQTAQTGEQYTFPENGVLKLLDDGLAPSAPDGKNPSIAGEKLVVYFDFAFKNAGLDLKDDTQISYKIKNPDRTTSEGTAKLDTSIPEIKNQYGYIGICIDVGLSLDKYEYAMFDLSFKDASGKEFFVKNKTVYKGISYFGINQSAFDEHLGDTVTTSIGMNSVKQTGTVNGTDFTFTITLEKWAEKTKPEQIVILSRLFWQCYPRMYQRFGEAGQSPTSVTLDIENGGYEIASASDNFVHLHDEWLANNKNDYDCITHELAHVIQNGWDGNKCEYSGFIERFADCCRYLYAFDNGKYNDSNWELQTIKNESTRETSVRFLVWLDYNYSTEEVDLLLNFFKVCRSKKYPANKWNDAWAEIFKGTTLEGKSIEEVWQSYVTSEFATLSSKGQFGTSPLLKKYKIRDRID